MTDEPQQPSEDVIALQEWVHTQMHHGWPKAGDVMLFGNTETRVVTAADRSGGPYTVSGPIIRTLTFEEKTKIPTRMGPTGPIPPPDEIVVDEFTCNAFPEAVGILGEPVALIRAGEPIWYHDDVEIEPPPAQGDA